MKKLSFIVLVFTLHLHSCQNKGDKTPNKSIIEKETIQKSNNMKDNISIFEIPANNINRAIDFYQSILDIKIDKVEMPGIKIGVFPNEAQTVVGVIMEAEGYKPSAEGTTIYLNAGDDLQLTLDKVEKYGGKVLIPKTPHADDSGYFAHFLDSEGNKIGLHSTN